MSPPPPTSRENAIRVVAGAAHRMDAGETRGRTLFPSPDFSHWPPFEMFNETSMVGGDVPDPHPHAHEEVVNYVLSGTLLIFDEARHRTEVPEGSVTVLSSVRPMIHDVNPVPGTRAHWLSLVLHLPDGTPEPKSHFQTAPVDAATGLPYGLKGKRIVGEEGPVRSALGLTMWDLTFEASVEYDPAPSRDRTALVYVLEGRVRAAGRELPAGSGLLEDGLATLPLLGEPGSRLIVATVPRSP